MTPTQAGDYVISLSHLQPGVAIKDVPSGYLAFLKAELDEGRLNPSLKACLEEYLTTDPSAADKLERGRRVPLAVVVKGFTPEAKSVKLE